MTQTDPALAALDRTNALNDQFLLLMGLIVFLMQAGFGLLEAGSVRAKNVTNILFKNYLDVAVAALSYWAIGWAISNSMEGNPFIAENGSFFLYREDEDANLGIFFFQFAFAATAATIVSGAVAERVKFEAYLIYSAIITAFIYPIGAYWGWNSNGWLLKGVEMDIDGVTHAITYSDFAGSGIVHCVGGTAALMGALVTGPRIARSKGPIPGHSIAFQALGGFILMFGFFAFNGGSQLTISFHSDAMKVGQSFVSTLLCGSSAMVVAVGIDRLFSKYWNLSTAINGSLAGMVAACGGCNVYRPYAAVIIGMVAGAVYIGSERLVSKLKIDDPLNAVAVHLGGGAWGVLAVPLFSEDAGMFYKSFDKPSLASFGWQCLGLFAYILWAGATSLGMFLLLKVTGLLRVTPEVEAMGLDNAKHGGPGYHMLMGGDEDELSTTGKVAPSV